MKQLSPLFGVVPLNDLQILTEVVVDLYGHSPSHICSRDVAGP